MTSRLSRSQQSEVAEYEAQAREIRGQEERGPRGNAAPKERNEMATEAIMTQDEAQTQALVPRQEAGTLALATMPEVDFKAHLLVLKQGQQRIRQIKKELMEDGSHYGTIPGTDKPALLKPGAETLCLTYRLRPDFIPTIEYGDGETQPHVRVTMRCELHVGDISGPVVAVGYGSANSWERKHRWRVGERACPSCGVEGTVRRSGYSNKGGAFKDEKGWWCRACKTNWDNPKEPAILEQQTGMVENKDPHELENTLLKMAEKRAHVDATLRGTASSDLFTQDVDEDADHGAPPTKNGTKPAPVREAVIVDEVPGEPPTVRLPAESSAAMTDPAALGAECVRLTGSTDNARELLKQIAGRESARGMKGPEVIAAWAALKEHQTFGDKAGR